MFRRGREARRGSAVVQGGSASAGALPRGSSSPRITATRIERAASLCARETYTALPDPPSTPRQPEATRTRCPAESHRLRTRCCNLSVISAPLRRPGASRVAACVGTASASTMRRAGGYRTRAAVRTGLGAESASLALDKVVYRSSGSRRRAGWAHEED